MSLVPSYNEPLSKATSIIRFRDELHVTDKRGLIHVVRESEVKPEHAKPEDGDFQI